ncbi:PaaX family transcriptional regulator C-terminal domain-containing protein [Nocardia sp. NPDC058518]|uniref:PaaX family transcriptional regulator C-terminal domain-containing protein n=1 Tax=Nocardia sp. NPDC058518 TaxID=3346534 RepID=UPI003665759F
MVRTSSRPRKLTARSAILSALLGAHPPQATVGGILAVAAELGLQESAVRVALTRMVASSDLERSDGVYRLSDRLVERQRRQDAAVAPRTRHWIGQWRLAVVTVGADDSTDRAAMRESLRAARFGELREGVWARPDNLDVDLSPRLRERVALFTALPEERSIELAERLFSPSTWASRATELVATYDPEAPMAARFELAAASVRHLLDDPLLPEDLLPVPWPGAPLRAIYERFRVEFQAFAEPLMSEHGDIPTPR